MGSQRVRQDWSDLAQTLGMILPMMLSVAFLVLWLCPLPPEYTHFPKWDLKSSGTLMSPKQSSLPTVSTILCALSSHSGHYPGSTVNPRCLLAPQPVLRWTHQLLLLLFSSSLVINDIFPVPQTWVTLTWEDPVPHLCILLCACIFWNNKNTCPNLLHISDTTSSLDTSNQNHFSVCDPPPVILALCGHFFFFFWLLASEYWNFLNMPHLLTQNVSISRKCLCPDWF